MLSLAVVALVLLCVWLNRDLARDNRSDENLEGNSVRSFWADFKQILGDRLALYVFAFFSIALFGMLFVSQLQMLAYVFFMKFRPEEKTFVHGGGMIAAGLGALFQAKVTDRFDKKTAGYAGMLIGVSGAPMKILTLWCRVVSGPHGNAVNGLRARRHVERRQHRQHLHRHSRAIDLSRRGGLLGLVLWAFRSGKFPQGAMADKC